MRTCLGFAACCSCVACKNRERARASALAHPESRWFVKAYLDVLGYTPRKIDSNGHVQYEHATYGRITFSTTPSDKRRYRANTLAALRRMDPRARREKTRIGGRRRVVRLDRPRTQTPPAYASLDIDAVCDLPMEDAVVALRALRAAA